MISDKVIEMILNAVCTGIGVTIGSFFANKVLIENVVTKTYKIIKNGSGKK